LTAGVWWAVRSMVAVIANLISAQSAP